MASRGRAEGTLLPSRASARHNLGYGQKRQRPRDLHQLWPDVPQKTDEQRIALHQVPKGREEGRLDQLTKKQGGAFGLARWADATQPPSRRPVGLPDAGVRGEQARPGGNGANKESRRGDGERSEYAETERPAQRNEWRFDAVAAWRSEVTPRRGTMTSAAQRSWSRNWTRGGAGTPGESEDRARSGELARIVRQGCVSRESRSAKLG